MFCPWTTKSLRITWARCTPSNLRSKTRQRATLLLLTWIYFCRLGGTVNFILPFMTKVTISISVSQIFRSWVEIYHDHAYGVFILQLIRYAWACSSYACFIVWATLLSNKLLKQGYVKERLKSSFRKFNGRRGYPQTIWSSPLTNAKWHSVAWPNTMKTLHR